MGAEEEALAELRRLRGGDCACEVNRELLANIRELVQQVARLGAVLDEERLRSRMKDTTIEELKRQRTRRRVRELVVREVSAGQVDGSPSGGSHAE